MVRHRCGHPYQCVVAVCRGTTGWRFGTWTQQFTEASRELLILDRHALHAQRLTFRHPFAEVEWSFEAPLPADMVALLDA